MRYMWIACPALTCVAVIDVCDFCVVARRNGGASQRRVVMERDSSLEGDASNKNTKARVKTKLIGRRTQSERCI